MLEITHLKELTAIPIHYEGATRTRRFSYDVHSEMYPAQPKCEKVAAGRGLSAKYYEKPFFLCEYAHAMGVGAGDLERYVKAFYSSDIMMGGCIWEFADHAVYHENSDYKYSNEPLLNKDLNGIDVYYWRGNNNGTNE